MAAIPFTASPYYDFNPSAATWAVLLSVMVVFVLAISGLFILMVDRGAASGPAPRPEAAPASGELDDGSTTVQELPTAS